MYGARKVNGVYVAERWVSELVFNRPKRQIEPQLRKIFLGY